MIGAIACGLLLVIAAEDLRGFRIRNARVGALLLLFGAAAAFGEVPRGGSEGLVWNLLFAGAVLILMMAAFAGGIVGAGDAKLMGAACLWVGPDDALPFALALSILALASIIGARFRVFPLKRADGRVKIPFGPSIAGACLTVIVLRSLF